MIHKQFDFEGRGDYILGRNVEIITDNNGKKLVRIYDIRFKGKRSVDWNDVKDYLREYVGEMYMITEEDDMIYIGTDIPDEYTGSRYTHKLMGTIAKAKANASQGIPELLEIADNKRFRATMLIRHAADGKMYLYDVLDIKKETSNSLGS